MHKAFVFKGYKSLIVLIIRFTAYKTADWAGADSNCQLLVYQTNTLPLSYTPKFGAEGIEPSMAVPKTAALPLGYAPFFLKNSGEIVQWLEF